MSNPRIFVSSTCYDLYDLRNNLRNFIQSFDYEPVMSEFGDIFYDYNMHVQDACLKEISKCQAFILIIGNNYGSLYHKSKDSDKNPPSVTMTEFKASLSTKIAKHIFINRFVKYDYDNYRRFLDQKYNEYFAQNDVPDASVDDVKSKIMSKFDSEYFFPHESYKHIFKFIDAINEISINNAIFPYETSTDIQQQLKKQWAGFMYEKLESVKKQEVEEQMSSINEIMTKLNKIDSTINNLVKNDNGGNVSLDIESIKNSISIDELEKNQNLFNETLNEIIYNEYSFHPDKRRGRIEEEIDEDMVRAWLDSVDVILKKYKWSGTIPFSTVFKVFKCSQFKQDYEVSYKTLFTLYGIYSKLTDEDKNSFIESVYRKLTEIIQLPDETNLEEVAATDDFDNIDIPF